MKHIILFALFALAACGTKDPVDPEPNPDIIPGEGIREIKLGDTGQKAVAAFGTGTSNYTKTNAQYFHYIVYADKGVQVNLAASDAATIDLSKAIENIELYSPYIGLTAVNTGMNSTQAEVRAAHGKPDLEDPFIPSDKYNSGIEFYYNESSLKVNRIIIDK